MKKAILLFFFISLSFAQRKISTKEFERIRNLDTIYIKFDKNLENHYKHFTLDKNNSLSSIDYIFKIKDNINTDFDVNFELYYNQNNHNDSIINKIKVVGKKNFNKYKRNCIDISFFKMYYKKTHNDNFYGCPKDFLWKYIYIIDLSESENNNLYLFPVEFPFYYYSK